MGRYSIGIDFGSLSARAVLMDMDSGDLVSSAVYAYPHGILEDALPDGTPLGPDSALQDADDYWTALHVLIPDVLAQAGAAAAESEQGFALLPALTRKYRKAGGTVYRPIPENRAVYERLYGVYRHLYDQFGKDRQAMKELKDIRLRAGKKGTKTQ